jgi:hypothetical protein
MMDPYIILADRYATSTLPDLAHSALPGAPQRPHVERRRLVGSLLAVLRRRPTGQRVQPRPVAATCSATPVP